ncbi:MAG: Pr6Pr family membrane protein [Bacteroidota bacterium]
MKKNISILLASVAWFAVLTQYYLMIENRVASIFETTIRFFSFFTILTNSLIAIYFSLSLLKKRNGFLSNIDKPGTLTAIAVYITIVGLVYQIVLRHIWDPTGIQMIVDELLHSVIPLLVFIFWYLYEESKLVQYKQIVQWLIYPFIYLIYILIRGAYSNFYPYPFVDVVSLGLIQVLLNSIGLIVFFIIISVVYIKIGKVIKRRK